MSRSYHVTERERRKDKYLNRFDDGTIDPSLSKLDELSLKKRMAKENEQWKRATEKVGGLRRTKFSLKSDKVEVTKQKCRGLVSDIKGEVLLPKDKGR